MQVVASIGTAVTAKLLDGADLLTVLAVDGVPRRGPEDLCLLVDDQDLLGEQRSSTAFISARAHLARLPSDLLARPADGRSWRRGAGDVDPHVTTCVDVLSPLGAIPVATFVSAEGVDMPTRGGARCGCNGNRRRLDRLVGFLTSTCVDVLSPLGAIPVATFVPAEGVDMPTGWSLLGHRRRVPPLCLDLAEHAGWAASVAKVLTGTAGQCTLPRVCCAIWRPVIVRQRGPETNLRLLPDASPTKRTALL